MAEFMNTSFLNFEGVTYNMPGMEYHANAIQHLLDNSYIKYPIGKLASERDYMFIHIGIIAVIIFFTLLLISRTEPITGFLIVSIMQISFRLFLHQHYHRRFLLKHL